MPISRSVGTGGANLKKDVRYVQALLNYWRLENGRLRIKVDGLVGPVTVGAIRDFQQLRAGIVDGRVDPYGPSIKALEAAFESYARTMKTYGALIFVLTYDPGPEQPMFNTYAMITMLRSAFLPIG
jgi:peptidoglycan hydrolase-like protein with peptidoglycan-binding domain